MSSYFLHSQYIWWFSYKKISYFLYRKYVCFNFSCIYRFLSGDNHIKSNVILEIF